VILRRKTADAGPLMHVSQCGCAAFGTIAGLALVSTTLHAIYTAAALYRFAAGSKDNGGIGPELLGEAFRQK
jgi:hypothetical protein